MAISDYGVIVWKDGKLMPKDCVSIGDERFTISFYKYVMTVCTDNDTKEDIFFGMENFHQWRCWKQWFYIDNFTNKEMVEVKIYPKRSHRYYICKVKYRNHSYKAAFGYGVDYDYYKKLHVIDYYNTWLWKAQCSWYWHGRPLINKVRGWLNK